MTGIEKIETLNYQLRKVTKARGHYPSDDAVVKLLWLAIINIEDKARPRAPAASRPGNAATSPPGSSRDSGSWAGARPSTSSTPPTRAVYDKTAKKKIQKSLHT